MRRITIFAAWSLLTVSSAFAQNEKGLVYTDWTKSCPIAKTGYICVTETRAHLPNATSVASIQLIESGNDSKRILRITLPLGTPLIPGTRLIVDQDSPINVPFISCLTDCIADHEVDADLLGKLKSAKQLAVQGIHSNGQPFSVFFPMADFGSVRDRLSSDTRVFGEPSRKSEFGRRNDDTLQPHLRR